MAVEFTCLYLDANSLICALESEDEDLRLRFRRLFETVSFFKIETSEISLAELLVDPHRTDDQARVGRCKKLFVLEGNGFLRVRPVSTNILTATKSFRGRQMQVPSHKPSLVDCIHAATTHH